MPTHCQHTTPANMMAPPPLPEQADATQQFIRANQDADVRTLALAPKQPDVDIKWALQQIEGRQLAARKLPAWAAEPDIWWPSRLSLEQCSSQATACYKAQLVGALVQGGGTFADLTGGFGVDFAAIAPQFGKALHVESNAVLSQLVRHNLQVLGLTHAEAVCADAESVGLALPATDVVLLDPARRTPVGRKAFLLDDCTPSVSSLLPILLPKTQFVVIKLSPMLDITAALRAIPQTAQVHVVSVDGECKELLLVVRGSRCQDIGHTASGSAATLPPTCFATLLRTSAAAQPEQLYFSFDLSDEQAAMPTYAVTVGPWLYEPDPAILKAGAIKLVAERYGVEKIAPMSHLYTSERLLPQWPGRIFSVQHVYTFSRADLKAFRQSTPRADLSVRGFPQSVAQLRAQLKLKEGSDAHVFATTLADGQKVLLTTMRHKP